LFNQGTQVIQTVLGHKVGHNRLGVGEADIRRLAGSHQNVELIYFFRTGDDNPLDLDVAGIAKVLLYPLGVSIVVCRAVSGCATIKDTNLQCDLLREAVYFL
jgi:hypothetical protein